MWLGFCHILYILRKSLVCTLCLVEEGCLFYVYSHSMALLAPPIPKHSSLSTGVLIKKESQTSFPHPSQRLPTCNSAGPQVSIVASRRPDGSPTHKPLLRRAPSTQRVQHREPRKPTPLNRTPLFVGLVKARVIVAIWATASNTDDLPAGAETP